MTDAASAASMPAHALTEFDTEHARTECRRLFHRYLAAWATDILALQRSGLDRPCVRDAWAPAAPMRQAA